ncbi:MAG: DUF4091 domain-containing protein [Chloroflexi bacterium]|nr:DUF4091 domain-containing protein [Chloroflexota bacterium]
MAVLNCWLQSSLERIFPSSEPRKVASLSVLAAANERISFQVGLRNMQPRECQTAVSIEPPNGLSVQVRRVGYVSVQHHNTQTEADELDGLGSIPGYVPDPLWPEDAAVLGPFETGAFWVNITAAPEVAPGEYTIPIRVFAAEESFALQVIMHVGSLVLQPREGFPVCHWFYADALCDWYQVEPFEEKFWKIVQPYMLDLVRHNAESQYVPIFTPPTDGIKRPTQLLGVMMSKPGRYAFDFSAVRRWVRLAQRCGTRFFEWTHLFTQWGAKYALRVYRSNADQNSLFWPAETEATSEVYRNFLSQFLPAFYEFLGSENLLNCSLFHLSDEPHGDEHLASYRKAKEMLKELAPWMRVADALSDVRFGREGVTDIPIPSISTAKQFITEGIPSWAYFCCGPRGKYINRLLDTPLPKIRMSGWLFYHLRASGFMHWGYNYWYKSQTQQLIDPFSEQAGCAWPGWAYGDTFLVYPGADGPVDSIRWEVFAESLQDYALLQSANIQPDDSRLEGLRDYNDFPKTAEWIHKTRASIICK